MSTCLRKSGPRLTKNAAMTRAFTLIYTLSLLTLLTRIQLNLLGRRNYLSSVISLASPPQEGSQISMENRDDDNLEQDYGNDFETNRKYLTFSWWLLHRGWEQIREKVEAAVAAAFAHTSPRDDISFQQLADLTLEIRKQVEGSTEQERKNRRWLSSLLPPPSEESTILRESATSGAASPDVDATTTPPHTLDPEVVTPSLRRLLDETSDLIESPTFTHVLTLVLDAAFSHLIDAKIGVQAYGLPAQAQSLADQFTFVPRVQDVTDEAPAGAAAGAVAEDPKRKTSKLATPMAIFTRQAHAIGSGGSISSLIDEPAVAAAAAAAGDLATSASESNEYLAAIEAVQDLNAFAAVVYSSNFEFEGVGAARGDDQQHQKHHQEPPTEAMSSFVAVEKAEDMSAAATTTTPGEAPPPQRALVPAPVAGVERDLESAWGKALAHEDGQA